MDIKTRKCIKKVLSGIDYDQVLLFGSRARGDFSRISDFDLLIIIKKDLSTNEKISLAGKIRKDLAKLGIDSDVIIKSNNEIIYYQDKIGSLIKNALKDGVVL